MLLHELFNNNQELNIRDFNLDDMDVEVNTQLSNGQPLRISFAPTDSEPPYKDYIVTFDRPREGRMSGDRTFAKTGEGSEVEVMSTVVRAIQQFVTKYDPNCLKFTANKPDEDRRDSSRANLYTRMVQRLAGNRFDVRINDNGNYTAYILTKKGAQNAPT